MPSRRETRRCGPGPRCPHAAGCGASTRRQTRGRSPPSSCRPAPLRRARPCAWRRSAALPAPPRPWPLLPPWLRPLLARPPVWRAHTPPCRARLPAQTRAAAAAAGASTARGARASARPCATCPVPRRRAAAR
eukprot:scaffold73068_cov31-Phaeocystis_antarctica.AAC.1